MAAQLTREQQILVVAATGGVFAFVGLILFFVFRFGPGHVFVVAPHDAALTVSVDGGEAERVEASGHTLLKVAQGDHTLRVEVEGQDGADVPVTVPSGFANVALGAPGHCYAELDVTDSHYGGHTERPELLGTFAGTSPRELDGVPAFSEAELPESISEHSRQTLVREIDCAHEGGTEAEVVGSLRWL